MMHGSKNLARLLGAMLTLVGVFHAGRALAGSAKAGEKGQVVLSVRPTVIVSVPQVAIRDVAVCEGGNAALREQIARLDLTELPTDGQTVSIAQEQIYYRIRIAGIDASQFRVRGAPAAAVTLPRYLVTEEDVVTAAKKAVLERLPESARDAAFQLSQPVRGLMVVPCPREQVGFEGELSSNAAPVGKVRVDVAVLVSGERRGVVPVFLEIKIHRQVAICRQQIERGEALTKDNIRLEKRTFDHFQDNLPPAGDVIGKRAKQPLVSGHVVTVTEIESSVPEVPILVKQQGLVKLVARLGSFQIVTIGEALQDGRPGQLIRVRNIDSKNVVVGRVVDRSLVEVDY